MLKCVAIDRKGRRVLTCTASLTATSEVKLADGNLRQMPTSVPCNPKGTYIVDQKLTQPSEVLWIKTYQPRGN